MTNWTGSNCASVVIVAIASVENKERSNGHPQMGSSGHVIPLCYRNTADKSMCEHAFGSTYRTHEHMLANFCILKGHACRHVYIRTLIQAYVYTHTHAPCTL